jgi:hypothetical protein
LDFTRSSNHTCARRASTPERGAGAAAGAKASAPWDKAAITATTVDFILPTLSAMGFSVFLYIVKIKKPADLLYDTMGKESAGKKNTMAGDPF